MADDTANTLTPPSPPSEFERWGYKGYGYPYITKETWTPPFGKHYGDTSSRYFQAASDWLPFLKA